MTAARAAELFTRRRAVSGAQLGAGAAAWGAFGSPDPRRISTAPLPELPFLAAALRRLLEEFPWTRDGLSRLERQVLEALRSGPLGFPELFARAHHRREDPVFLGDAVLRWHLDRLRADGFVAGKEQWRLTSTGARVLAGERDAWAVTRRPRWLGGCEVRDGRPRWDPAAGRLVT
jgi:hypothetical protein